MANIWIHINKLWKKDGKIWIGAKIACSKKFAEKYAKIILEEAEKRSKINCNKYACRYLQPDIASDSVMYILQKCGEIEKNFENNESISKELIRLKIRTYIKYRCMQQLKKPREKSFVKRYQNHKGDEKDINVFDRGIKDDSQNIEDEVERKVLSETKEIKKSEDIGQTYAEILMQNINQGLTVQEALEKMENQLDMNQEEILKELRTYMIKTKQVRQTKDGGFILGE